MNLMCEALGVSWSGFYARLVAEQGIVCSTSRAGEV